LVRTIFAQPTARTLAYVNNLYGRYSAARFPKVAKLLLEAEEEILAHMGFPPEHRTKLHPTNPLERIDGEIKRRTRVVGMFPAAPRRCASWAPSSWKSKTVGRGRGTPQPLGRVDGQAQGLDGARAAGAAAGRGGVGNGED
jgi:hypothetical protein